MSDAPGHPRGQAGGFFMEDRKEAGKASFETGKETPECPAVVHQKGSPARNHGEPCRNRHGKQQQAKNQQQPAAGEPERLPGVALFYVFIRHHGSLLSRGDVGVSSRRILVFHHEECMKFSKLQVERQKFRQFVLLFPEATVRLQQGEGR